MNDDLRRSGWAVWFGLAWLALVWPVQAASEPGEEDAVPVTGDPRPQNAQAVEGGHRMDQQVRPSTQQHNPPSAADYLVKLREKVAPAAPQGSGMQEDIRKNAETLRSITATPAGLTDE
eukprot:1192396-Prorocentrum_minimum.AAC.1